METLEARVEYLERKVYDLIETVNVLVEAHNTLLEAVQEASKPWLPFAGEITGKDNIIRGYN